MSSLVKGGHTGSGSRCVIPPRSARPGYARYADERADPERLATDLVATSFATVTLLLPGVGDGGGFHRCSCWGGSWLVGVSSVLPQEAQVVLDDAVEPVGFFGEGEVSGVLDDLKDGTGNAGGDGTRGAGDADPVVGAGDHQCRRRDLGEPVAQVVVGRRPARAEEPHVITVVIYDRTPNSVARAAELGG